MSRLIAFILWQIMVVGAETMIFFVNLIPSVSEEFEELMDADVERMRNEE